MAWRKACVIPADPSIGETHGFAVLFDKTKSRIILCAKLYSITYPSIRVPPIKQTHRPQINDEQRTALTLLCDLIKIDSQNDHEAKVALHLQQFLAS